MTRILALFFVTILTTALSDARASKSSLPHEVLAFYYGWYAPQYGQDWAPKARWTPSAGGYNSMDVQVIDRQMTEMQQAGMTGLIASWWGAGGYTDRQLAILLPRARKSGLSVTVLIEDIGSDAAPGDAATAYEELDYLLSSYGRQPNWLRVKGRPVIFLYDRALKRLPTAASWNGVLDRIRAKHHGAIILAPGQHNPGGYAMAAARFDSLFSYSLTDLAKGAALPELEARLRKADQALVANAASDIACLTVEPGYDDSKTGRALPRPLVQRFNGATYRASWRAALAANPDWVLVSTYNEWMEGTQVEPSVEFGTASLRDTAAYSAQFLAAPGRVPGS